MHALSPYCRTHRDLRQKVDVNALLSVAGGLAGIYIIFALLTSRISEAISSLTNKRATTLYDGIAALLGATVRTKQPPGQGEVATSLAEHLYAHPLVSTLGDSGPRKPSYMEPRTFTLSLVSVLRDTVAIDDAQGHVRVVDIASAPHDLLEDLQQRICALGPDDPTCKSLTLVLQGAGATYDSALAAIDAWFETQMDRLSGVYRRWIGFWQALIALVLVGSANADTLGIAQQLFKDSNIASAVPTVARNPLVHPASEATATTFDALVRSGLVLGWNEIPHDPGQWFAKFGGLALTWGAVLLGAPFWFDLLKQVIPVRVAGIKPKSSTPHRQTAVPDAQTDRR